MHVAYIWPQPGAAQKYPGFKKVQARDGPSRI